MKVAILGNDGPLAAATRAALERRGHRVDGPAADCAVCFPDTPEHLREALARGAYSPAPPEHPREALARGAYSRVVLRSHACVYGASPKNPGLLTEDRPSLLPP